jgi:hypothetical protein
VIQERLLSSGLGNDQKMYISNQLVVAEVFLLAFTFFKGLIYMLSTILCVHLKVKKKKKRQTTASQL